MPSRQQLERTLIKLGKATPAGLRGRLGRATRSLRRQWRGSSVTVVVAVSDTETSRVAPCLHTLRAQTHRNIDIRVVPYADAERALAVARQHAVEDWRIRIEDAQPDRASAWNVGAGLSSSRYLVFARGADDVPPSGIERMVTALDASGSDFAVGRQRSPFRLHASTEPPYGAAHGAEVRRTTLAETPIAVTDLGVGNRMVRREFWERAGLGFQPGDLPGDQASASFALTTYTRAAAFDLLTTETYEPTGRVEGLSVGAVRDVLSLLDDWIAEHEATRREIESLGIDDVTDWWLWGVLDAAVQPLLDDVERASSDQWVRLRELVGRLLESGGDRTWDHLGSDSRVKLWLVSRDLRDRLEEFVTQRLFDGTHRPTEVRDGSVIGHLPFYDDPAVGVPESAYVMQDRETPLWTQLNGIRWTSAEAFELRCYARILLVDTPEDPVVRAWLVEEDTGDRIPLEVVQSRDLHANIVQPSRYQDYSRGTAVLRVDAAELAARASAADRPLRWSVQIEMTVQGITRTGSIARIDDRGSAGMIETGHLGARTVGAARVGVKGRTAGFFRVIAAPWAGPELVDVQVDGGTVRGRIRLPDDEITAVRLVPGVGAALRGRVSRDGDLTTFAVDVPALPVGDEPRRFEVRVRTRSGGERQVGWPTGAPQWLGVGAGDVVLSRTTAGDVDVIDAVGTLVAEELRHTPDEIVLSGRWLGRPPAEARITAGTDRVRVDGTFTTSGDGVRVTFPAHWDEWGLGPLALPADRYTIRLQQGPSANRLRNGRVLLGEEQIVRLLEFDLDDTHRFRPTRTGRLAGFQLLPPLGDDERAPYSRAQLQQWFATCELPVDPSSVYLQAYAGGSATDSQLAIFEVLRERRPDLTVHWGIADRSSWVPEGALPVVLHSREHYRVMATAGRLCMNIDPDRWFRLRPGQQLLQTFHGYPAKSMGIRMWEAKGFTPRRIELELQRTSGSWSLILTPAPEMDDHYRREYRYDGAIHSRGYPRDDLLLSPEADRVREETRARLGISPDQKVVLYAPTWRDDAATNWRQADLVSHLDLETASRKLGRDYVLLMRGHRFHAASTARSDGARLIDVTTYPEINHLILASDAAVLDYSSLRFDFAITKRPMIFLVPDLDSYTGGIRGFLYPFEDSAPGPLAQTADEVIGWLRDLDRLRAEYAGEVDRFHERFNYLQDGHSAESVVEAFFG